jgi:ABC-type branched-subunit amino acid transport system substrate-binding protein
VESARKLVSTDGATCLTGPWSSEAVAQTAQDVAIPSKVLEISPVAAGDDVAELSDHDLIDSTALPVSTEGEALKKAIERALGGVEGFRVNVAASTDPSSGTIARDFIQSWQGDDGTVGAHIALAPPSLSNQASQITGNSPDAVLLVDNPTGFGQLAPALESSNGWDPATAWGNDQLVSPGIPAEVGSDAVEGMLDSPRSRRATRAPRPSSRTSSPRLRGGCSWRRSPPRSSTPRSSATWRRWPPARRTARRWPTS